MNADHFERPSEWQRLYRATARERTSAATDAEILQTAREHARRNRWRRHATGLTLVAAVALIAFFTQIASRQRAEVEAIHLRYAAITLPYLLDSQADASPVGRATRYLLERRESERSSPPPGDTRIVPQPRGT